MTSCIELHKTYPLEDFWAQKLEKSLKHGAFIVITSGEEVRHIVVSHCREERSFIDDHHTHTRLHFMVKTIFGLKLPDDTQVLWQYSMPFGGPVQYCDKSEMERYRNRQYRNLAMITVVAGNYFEYIQTVEPPLKDVLLIPCIRIVQEYMA